MSKIKFSLQHYMNHSNSVLNPCLEKVGKTNSVSSLSVGVQYDLRDVVSEEHLTDGGGSSRHHHHHTNHHRESLRGSHNHSNRRQLPSVHNPRYTATAVEYIPSNGLRGSVHSRKNNFHHVSAPDFQRYTSVSATIDPTGAHHPRHHHRHHHVHHIHHKSSAQGGSRTLQRNYEPYYGFGSLGRAGTYRSTANPINTQVHALGGNLSESDPEVSQVGQVTASNWTNHDLHPPPVKTARLSNETPKSRSSSTTSRRYGSIRVAECSFVEAGGSQPSTPTSASIVEVKHHPYSIGAYDRNQYFDEATPPIQSNTSNQTSATTHRGSLCGPESNCTNSTVSQRLCNGPLSVGLAAAAASYVSTGSRGSNGQHSHIIPPPQNFCSNGSDFGAQAHHPLTTTRIGSTINLASRMTDFYQQHRQQQQHNQRSDSPPF